MNSPEQLAQHFSRHLYSYHQHAEHQRFIADKLAQQLCRELTHPCQHALEIGCGSGFLTTALARHWRLAPITRYALNDLYAPPALKPPADEVYPYIGDISERALPMDLDLVLSASVLQWIEHLDPLLRRIHQAMRRNALFACSMYVGAHYQELRHTLGIGLNYHPPSNLSALFSAYFQPLWSRTLCSRDYFPDPHAVLSHIRASGLHTFSEAPAFSAWRQFRSAYETLRDEQGYPLTQHAFLFIGIRR